MNAYNACDAARATPTQDASHATLIKRSHILQMQLYVYSESMKAHSKYCDECMELRIYAYIYIYI